MSNQFLNFQDLLQSISTGNNQYTINYINNVNFAPPVSNLTTPSGSVRRRVRQPNTLYNFLRDYNQSSVAPQGSTRRRNTSLWSSGNTTNTLFSTGRNTTSSQPSVNVSPNSNPADANTSVQTEGRFSVPSTTLQSVNLQNTGSVLSSMTNLFSHNLPSNAGNVSYFFEISRPLSTTLNTPATLQTLTNQSELVVLNNTNQTNFEDTTCSICSQDFDVESGTCILRRLHNCQHYFHQHCLDRWFTTHSTCPICRTNINSLSTRLHSDTLSTTLSSTSTTAPTTVSSTLSDNATLQSEISSLLSSVIDYSF